MPPFRVHDVGQATFAALARPGPIAPASFSPLDRRGDFLTRQWALLARFRPRIAER